MNKYHIYILFIAFVSIFSSCKNRSKESKTLNQKNSFLEVLFNEDQFRLGGVEIARLEKRIMSEDIKLNGEIINTPSGKVIVSAVLGGNISSVNLIEGQYVKKGESLFEIENIEYVKLQKEYLRIKSDLTYLKTEYKRQEKLRKQNINSEKKFQKTTNEFHSAKANLKALEQILSSIGFDTHNISSENISSKLTIKAPISGNISIVNINNGSYVEAKDILLEIINNDKLLLKLNAFEKDFEHLSLGQSINFSTVKSDSFDNTATLSSIGQIINTDRTISLIGSIKSEGNFLSGMFVKAKIKTNTKERCVIMSDGVVDYKGIKYIIQLKNKTKDCYKFKLIPVKIAVVNDKYTSIELPDEFNIQESDVVVKNAYVILASLINSQEE
ncbi:MAG: efflux RND transporter periplasmic adaptor subunit [Marinifilaceae bacterium]|jgi:cobalt-zinc-cadmium efflux system membrane fusion protein|nr:efflux RND transporter periplasmic adaptor subunit [Marinifilaceae bacterium]